MSITYNNSFPTEKGTFAIRGMLLCIFPPRRSRREGPSDILVPMGTYSSTIARTFPTMTASEWEDTYTTNHYQSIPLVIVLQPVKTLNEVE